MKKRILVIGDVHAPFIDKRVFSRIIDDVVPGFKPHIILQIGDAFDLASWSRFPKAQRDPESEILEAVACMSEFWEVLKKRAPRAKRVQLLGNHDKQRVEKLVLSKAPELKPFVKLDQFYEFPGVETHQDAREPFIVDDIAFTHGHRTKLALHLQDFQYKYNVCIGHLHTAQTHYERVGGPMSNVIRWAHCAGYVADPFSEQLNYRPLNKYFKWTQGVTLIEQGWPTFRGL